jgi:cytochrome c556
VKSGKAEDIAEWKKFAKAFQVEMTAASAAFKKKDMTAAGDAWKKGNTACNDCHAKFRPNE